MFDPKNGGSSLLILIEGEVGWKRTPGGLLANALWHGSGIKIPLTLMSSTKREILPLLRGRSPTLDDHVRDDLIVSFLPYRLSDVVTYVLVGYLFVIS